MILRSLLLTGLLFTAAQAADPKTADAVRAAEKAWATATVKADEAALNQLLAAGLHYTHSNGEIDTRASFIGNMKTGVRKYAKLDHEGMDAKIYGNVAVVTATAQVATTAKGGAPAPAHLRFIHVWVHEQGRWQMVNHQSLRLTN